MVIGNSFGSAAKNAQLEMNIRRKLLYAFLRFCLLSLPLWFSGADGNVECFQTHPSALAVTYLFTVAE